MALINRYCAIYLFFFLTERFILLQTTANNVGDIRNELYSLLNREEWVVRQGLRSKYPNLLQIAMQIYSKTQSSHQSLCQIISDNFMDTQCSLGMFPHTQRCLGRTSSRQRSDIWRGCYDIQRRTDSRHRREITQLRSTSDTRQRSKNLTSTRIIAPTENSSTAESQRVSSTQPTPQTPKPQASPTQQRTSSSPPELLTQMPPSTQVPPPKHLTLQTPQPQAPPLQPQTSSFPPVPATQAPPETTEPPCSTHVLPQQQSTTPPHPSDPPTTLPLTEILPSPVPGINPVANFYFLAINIIAKTVSASYEQRCNAMNGHFDRNRLICLIPQTSPPQPETEPPPPTTMQPLPPTTHPSRPQTEPLPPTTVLQLPNLDQQQLGQTSQPETRILNTSEAQGRQQPIPFPITQPKPQQQRPTQKTTKQALPSAKVKLTITTPDTANFTDYSRKYFSNYTSTNSSTTTSNNRVSSNTSFSFRGMSWLNFTMLSFKIPSWLKTVAVINITGHSCSLFSLCLLIATYFLLKPEFTLMDKNIVCLSSSLLVAHCLQLNMVFFSNFPMFCKWGAVLLHWSLLLSFMWIAAISFDLYTTFKSMKPVTIHSRKQRFKKYSIAALGMSTTIIVVCVAMGIPREDFAGYGDKGRCFIVKFWPNLFAFTVPITTVMVASVILTVLTMCKLRSKEKETSKALSNGNSRASSRKKIVTTSLFLKLSVLFGFGWLIGFINGFIGSVPLSIIFNVIVSFQGMFIYLAFGEQRSLLRKCFKKIQSYRQREAVSRGTTYSNGSYQTTAL